MAPQPEARPPLEVQGNLHLHSPRGHALVLATQGQTLQLDVSHWRAAQEALTVLSGSALRGEGLRMLHRALCAMDLQMEITLNRRRVAGLGPRSRPTLLARVLGLAPAAIHPWGALLGLFGSQR